MVKCKDCIFFDPFKAEGDNKTDLGYCRKNAPTLFSYLHKSLDESLFEIFQEIKTNTKAKTLWPIVGFDDYCGEGIKGDEYILHNMVQKRIYTKRLAELLKDQYEVLKHISPDLIASEHKNYWSNIKLRLEEMIEVIESALQI